MNDAWKRARIIFVCSGNICRSPMAERMCNAMLRERGYEPMVLSMGTLDITGRSAHPHAVSALAEIDLDLSDHRSQGVKGALLNAADVAFAMERHHLDAMRQYGQGAFRSSRLLSRWAPERLPGIDDPVAGSLDDFRHTRDLIGECLERWFADVVEAG